MQVVSSRAQPKGAASDSSGKRDEGVDRALPRGARHFSRLIECCAKVIGEQGKSEGERRLNEGMQSSGSALNEFGLKTAQRRHAVLRQRAEQVLAEEYA